MGSSFYRRQEIQFLRRVFTWLGSSQLGESWDYLGSRGKFLGVPILLYWGSSERIWPIRFSRIGSNSLTVIPARAMSRPNGFFASIQMRSRCIRAHPSALVI